MGIRFVFPTTKYTWRWFCLLGATLALTSCAALLGRPEKGITISRQAKVCFRQSEQARILASVAPSECYSMRCTRLSMATGTAFLDRRVFRLKFETTFNLMKTRSLLPCTPDCVGGGSLEFDLGQLDPGRYQVYLWNGYLGDLDVTSGLPWRDQCLSAEGTER